MGLSNRRAASRRSEGTTRARNWAGDGSLSVRGRCTGTAPARGWVVGEALRHASPLGCKAGMAGLRKGAGGRETNQAAPLRPLILRLLQGAPSPQWGRVLPAGARALPPSPAPPAPPFWGGGWAVCWGPPPPPFAPLVLRLSTFPHRVAAASLFFGSSAGRPAVVCPSGCRAPRCSRLQPASAAR